MRLHRRDGLSAAIRERIESLGLSDDELACLQTAAGGNCKVLVSALPQGAMTDASVTGIVRVASLAWVEAMHAEPAILNVLLQAPFVLLIPADASGERHRWGARIARNAHLVITKLPETVLALHTALQAVRHSAVAELLVCRLGISCHDLPTRALVAAVRLAPCVREVPALARVLYMSERTLRRQLEAVSPSLAPHRLPNWACLLHTAWHLRARDHSFERVAGKVGAFAPSNLHRLLRRYTGYSARDLRSLPADPLTTVFEAWRAEVSGTKATSQARLLRASTDEDDDSTQ